MLLTNTGILNEPMIRRRSFRSIKKIYKNKLLITESLLIIVSFFTIACARSKERSENPGDILEIRERMFVAQVSNIYLNTEDYLGRTIKFEGIFKQGQTDERLFYYVARYAPGGCCGNDGMIGFEVKWTPDLTIPYPADNSWVEATGILMENRMDFDRYLYLELSSLLVLTRRGAEFVRQ
jgi:uncharacterized membrane protein YcgQ (UPF0703/DUF1980 family)